MQAVAQRLLGLGRWPVWRWMPSSWRLNWSFTSLTETDAPPTQP